MEYQGKFYYSEEMLESLKQFLEYLAQEPERKDILMNEVTQTEYIPIDVIEVLFDNLVLGQWSTKNFKYQYTQTKVIGSIEVEFVHPITGITLLRTGAAAIKVEQKTFQTGKDSTATYDVELSQPALLSLCTVSAIRKVGRILGRSLNRDIVDLDSQAISTELQKAIDELSAMNSVKEVNDSKAGLIQKYEQVLNPKELKTLNDLVTKKIVALFQN